MKAREKMDKYERALKRIGDLFEFEESSQVPHNDEIRIEYKEDFDLLEELVERAKPMKPYFNCDDWHCSKCDEIVFLGEWEEDTTKPNFCSNCGQALDWSE